MEIVTFEKYLPELYKEFPDIDEKSIKDVVKHGLSLMGFFQTKGHDILVNNNRKDLYYYFGQVTNVPARRFEISRKKYRRKIRLMHSLRKTEYPGHMFFSLTDAEYQLHLEGKPIPRVYIYKCLEEAKLFRLAKHYFKITMDNPKKWLIIEENYETTNAEYIC